MSRFRAACVQLNAGPAIGPNIAVASDLIRDAAARDADYVQLPENAVAMNFGRRAILDASRTEADHPALAAFSELARELAVILHVGSLHIRLAGERCANRTYLIGRDGAVMARYGKIHMFDVDLAGGESYRESKTFEPGQRAVVAPLPGSATFGLSICYDVRFPHLYRDLAQAGATVLTVPAAFTRQTGRAHWHLLLRARAVENGAYVIAAAQTGTHGKRQTYGHSLIVAPWGEVLADAGEDVGVITADIDLDKVREARAAVPSLDHDRAYAAPEPAVAPAAGLALSPAGL